MKTIPSWCHLAALILQDKKEQALTLYRIQSSSHSSPARAREIEADLRWACGDGEAIHLYHHAAQLYRQENDLRGARRVYQQLSALQPDDHEVRLLIIFVALELCDEECVHSQLAALADAVKKGELATEQHQNLLQRLAKRCEVLERQGVVHTPRNLSSRALEHSDK